MNKYVSNDILERIVNEIKKTQGPFWGLLAILQSLGEPVQASVIYEINAEKINKIKKFLTSLFYFGDDTPPDTTSKSSYAIFSNQWTREFKTAFFEKDTKVNFYLIALWAFRDYPLPANCDMEILKNLFLKRFNIPHEKTGEFLSAFDMKIPNDISAFSALKASSNDTLKKLKEISNDTTDRKAYSTGVFVASSPWELTRAPFVQPLYAGQSVQKCLLFSSIPLSDFYDFLGERKEEKQTSNNNNIAAPRNLIYFGAPGTGKSNQLKKDAEKFRDNSERVTFYPNYSYAQFVGTYKPVMQLKNSPNETEIAEEEIVYSYVPGPFIRQWIKAQNTSDPVLLIIEELNRANAPAVFGDMFQLLDRKNGESEYPVATSEDLRKYLSSLLPNANSNVQRDVWEKLPEGTDVTTLKIPKNLYIWATMNSADQGVFPLDTAFKRRWDYKYFSVYDRKENWPDNIDVQEVVLHGHKYEWGTIREKINDFLAKKNVNEDKFIGPYFISDTVFSADTQEKITENFIGAFNDKVIMYLFEDAARQYRKDMFQLTEKDAPLAYSKICKEFKKHGFAIFRFAIPATQEKADTANEGDVQK